MCACARLNRGRGELFFCSLLKIVKLGLQASCCDKPVVFLELVPNAACQKVKLETQDSAGLCWLQAVRTYTFLPEHKPQLKQPNKTQNLEEPASCLWREGLLNHVEHSQRD